MSATTNGKSWFNLGAESPDPGSEKAREFLKAHDAWLAEGRNMVDLYVSLADGDACLLLDACLLALAQRVRDALAAQGVKVQALPPSIGDELSNKVQ